MFDLANAIKDLIIEYDKACKLDFVEFPLGYALYHVWEQYDREYRQVKQMIIKKGSGDNNAQV